MHYGIETAPEIFFRICQETFKVTPNAEIYIDDIFICAENDEEIKNTFEKTFARAQEEGIKFNLAKRNFSQPSVKFLEHVFSKNGIATVKNRIHEILNIEKPKDRKGVQRLLV